MQFRYARHTANIKVLAQFYVDILGLEILGQFLNHDEYNGVFIGIPGEAWHIEFTESFDAAQHTFDEDDVLVFYPSTWEAYQSILNQIEKCEIPTYQPKNPYWVKNGILIKDPDNYNVIISAQRVQEP